MNILLVAVHYAVASGRYMAQAFRRAGNNVRTIGPAMGRDIWGLQVSERDVWTPQGGLDAYWPDWTPDLIVLMDTALVGYKHPRYTAPMVVYSVDNHVRQVRQDGVAGYFLAHFHGPADPVNLSQGDVWLPCAYDPILCTPSPIPWREREFDVCMIGYMYPLRVEIIEAMRAAGLKVKAEIGLVYDQYRAAYQNSRISLCTSAAQDVAQRIYETAAMGCAIMTDPLLDLMDRSTNYGLGLSGFMQYCSVPEAVDVAKGMLEGGIEAGLMDIGAAPVKPTLGESSAAAMQASVKRHTWDARAKVIIQWAREHGVSEQQAAVEEVPAPMVIQANPVARPFLNLGCGKTHLPGAIPPGHELAPPELYQHPLWLNIDKVEGVGADKVFDLFSYPWPLADASYDGALLSHLVEHIPHDIKTSDPTLAALQDGWYAFFAELWRVLTPGAKVHIIAPYGWSDGGITDPSHTRLLTINTFTHSMETGDGGTFTYKTGGSFRLLGETVRFRTTEMYHHLAPAETDTPELLAQKQSAFRLALMTNVNVVYDFYLQLERL